MGCAGYAFLLLLVDHAHSPLSVVEVGKVDLFEGLKERFLHDDLMVNFRSPWIELGMSNSFSLFTTPFPHQLLKVGSVNLMKV